MKKRHILMIMSLLAIFTSCKKSSDDNVKGWTEADQASYDHILSLQKLAAVNYHQWSESMDSIEAINKLYQYFLSDSSVASANIDSSGIAVLYTSGMRGGIFINPRRGGGGMTYNPYRSPGDPIGVTSLVSSKKAILLSPCYWDKENITTDEVLDHYKQCLPKAGLYLDKVYKSDEATLDRFTELSGYGLIHIDSHGLIFKIEPYDTYMTSGEVANQTTTLKYAEDLKNGIIVIPLTYLKDITDPAKMLTVYWFKPAFITSHNDFSKDTTIFIGSFCYSGAQSWKTLNQKFAKCTYFGYHKTVLDKFCVKMSISLMDSLCDTLVKKPYTTGRWFNGLNPKKVDDRGCRMELFGDPETTLWKEMEIETSPITNITQTTAKGGGNLKSDNGFPVTSKGICWSTSPNPTIADSKTSDGSGIGVFVSNLANLTANTLYYVRAYATNNQGKTFYGNLVSFTTQQQGGQTVTDIDGNVYNLVTIGTQVWLVENLKTTHYSNGDQVPNLTKNAAWSETKDGAWCDNNNDGNNGQIYGHLYNWRAAADSRNLCPNGWHVPTDAEWTVLDDFLLWHVGGKLKEAGTAHWMSPNTGATNESGFTALPAGSRTYGGLFNEPGYAAEFWSSTISPDPTNAYIRSLGYDDDFMYRNQVWIEAGFSVRCLKN